MSDFLLKLLDLVLGGAIEKWREKRALKHNFDAARRAVLYCGITNNLPVELHKLRTLMIEHGLVESSESCRNFFAKWLTHPLVVEGRAALNAFRHDEIHQIERELIELAL